jgi:hypothetical protein
MQGSGAIHFDLEPAMKAILLGVFLLAAMNAAAFAATCTQARTGCVQGGDTFQNCEARRVTCMATGCWNSAMVHKCGYQKK